MDLQAYLDDLPLLHTSDRGATWNTGGFLPSQLERMHQIVAAHLSDRPVRILETGAGNSTITFLLARIARLVTIAPAADLRDRILSYCAAHEVDTSPLDFHVERSEIELPRIALGAGAGSEDQPARPPEFDVVLIDGAHGWPTVFVDFCYANMMMRSGSVLFLDDTPIHSVAELSRLLAMQPGFHLREEIKKLQVWEKDDDRPFLPGHALEPYIVDRTAKAAHRSLARRALSRAARHTGLRRPVRPDAVQPRRDVLAHGE